MVEPTHLKNMLVKLDHLPQFSGWKFQKSLKPPTRCSEIIPSSFFMGVACPSKKKHVLHLTFCCSSSMSRLRSSSTRLGGRLGKTWFTPSTKHQRLDPDPCFRVSLNLQDHHFSAFFSRFFGCFLERSLFGNSSRDHTLGWWSHVTLLAKVGKVTFN